MSMTEKGCEGQALCGSGCEEKAAETYTNSYGPYFFRDMCRELGLLPGASLDEIMYAVLDLKKEHREYKEVSALLSLDINLLVETSKMCKTVEDIQAQIGLLVAQREETISNKEAREKRYAVTANLFSNLAVMETVNKE